ncbi:sigma factor-like helix-turn-helix DNA-binding protein [Microbispora rosea]|uniref:sigma factor-like helix-turn-helix DNA-binding protein n=1 Tax=Microbispora rosea TaxID=58117 RepID=UPI0034368010
MRWLQPYPDALLEFVPDAAPGPEARYTAREAVELAFVAALQRIPPRQTAVLVLCDVLGYPLSEVAAMLGTTPTAVKGLLQRARASMDHRRAEPPAPRSAPERHLVRRFAEAFTCDDIDTLVALLTDDAWLSMPPAPHEYHGAAAIASFLRASAEWRAGRRLKLEPTRANGQPAFTCSLDGEATGVIVLTLTGDGVRGITRFLDGRLQEHFEARRTPCRVE